MNHVLYPSDKGEPVTLSPVDPDAVVIIGVDWSEWLQERGLSAVNESTWHPSTGAVLGDGATTVTRKGKTVTPQAPAIVAGEAVTSIANGMTLVSVYLEDVEADQVIALSNHIRAGQLLDEVTVQFTVKER